MLFGEDWLIHGNPEGGTLDDREMPLTEHLAELRKRLIWVLLTIAVTFLAGFFVSKPVLDWLIRRAHVRHIIVTGVPEAFFALLKVDMVMALVVSSPVILYQAAAFVMPGLSKTERRVVGVILGPGLILFLAGMAAGFLIFVPIVLHVMKAFIVPQIEERWTLNNYLSFVINLTVPFGFIAELPLIAGVLARLGLVHPGAFRRYRRYAVLIAFFIAAILAPPDALSMLLMAVPLYLIYELSAVVARIFYKPASAMTAEPVEGIQEFHDDLE